MAKNLFLYTTILQIFVFVHFVEFVHAQTKKYAIPSWVAPRLDDIDRHNTLFSPNDSLLCTFTADFAYIWNATDGSLVNSIRSLKDIHEVVFNSSSNRILIHSDLGIKSSGEWGNKYPFTLWNTKDGNRVVDIDIDGRRITDAKFNLSGDLVVAATTSGKIGLWNSITGKLLYSIKAHGIKVTGQTDYWTGRIRTNNYDYASIRYVEFSRDGKLFLSVGEDGTVKIWNVRDGKLLKTISESIDLFPKYKNENWETRLFQYVRAVFHPYEDKVLVSGGKNRNALKLWSTKTGSLLHEYEFELSDEIVYNLSSGINGFSYDTSGRFILVYRDDPSSYYGYLSVYETSTGENLRDRHIEKESYKNYYLDISSNTITISNSSEVRDIQQEILIGDYYKENELYKQYKVPNPTDKKEIEIGSSLYGIGDLYETINLTDGQVIKKSRYWHTSKSRKRAIVKLKNESGLYIVDTETNSKVCKIYYTGWVDDSFYRGVNERGQDYPNSIFIDSYGMNCIIGLNWTVILTRLDSCSYEPLNCDIDDWIEDGGNWNIHSVAVNNQPDDKFRAFAVISTGNTSNIRLWDVSNRRHIGDLDTLVNNDFHYATFNSKGDRIYTLSTKGAMIWDSKDGSQLKHFKDIIFHRDSYLFNEKHDLLLGYDKLNKYRIVETIGDRGGCSVYDINSGKILYSIPDNGVKITDITMMKNGDYLAYSTVDGMLNIIEAKSGNLYKSLNVGYMICSIQFSYDNKYVILVLSNGTIEIRKIETGSVYKMLRTRREYNDCFDFERNVFMNKSNSILLDEGRVWDVDNNKLLSASYNSRFEFNNNNPLYLEMLMDGKIINIDYNRELVIVWTSKNDVLAYSLKDFY